MSYGILFSLAVLAMVTPPGNSAVPEALEQNMAAGVAAMRKFLAVL